LAALPTTSNNGITGTWSPALNNTATTTYTFTPTTGVCATTATTQVVVTAIPTATISYSGLPFCSTLTSGQAVTLTGTGAYTGGTYTSTTGLSINSTTGEITPSTSTPGNYVVTYTIAAAGGCASVPVTTNVVITPIPTATITYVGSPFCSILTSSQAVTLTGTGAYTGGTYTSTTGLTINSTSGAITPSTSTPGNYIVSYTIAAAGGCPSVPVTTNVIFTPIPTATISYSGSPFCSTLATAQAVALTGTAAFMGGTYSSTTGLTINPTTGAITPSTSTPGNYVVTYTIAAASGCPAIPATTNVVITPLPTATIAYAGSPFCATLTTAQPVTLTGTGAYTGGTYTSTTGLSIDPTTGSITPSTSTPGSYIVSYTIATAGGCSPVVTTTPIVINPIPVATATVSANSICTLSATNITLSSDVVGTTFNWTVIQNNVTGATNGSGALINQILTNSSFAIGTVDYQITPIANGCSGNAIQTRITVNPTPDVIANPTTQDICTGQSTSINLSGNVIGTTYNWTVTQVDVLGASAGSGNSIAQILNTNSTNYGVANYTITPTANNCVGNPIVVPINITPKPVIVATPNVQTICSGDPITPIILTSNITGTTYNWTVTQTNVSGAIIGSGNSITQTLTNNSTIQGQASYTINSILNNCPGNSSSALVNVNPTPLVNSNTINQTICSNENTNITLTSTVSNTLFSWTVTQTNVTGALSGSGNNINQTLINNTTITGLATYNVTPIATGCSGLPLLISVNVKPKPRLTNALNATICSMQTTNISLTSNIVGSTFSWTATTTGPTGFSNAQGNTIAQQLQNNANYYGTVTYDVTPTFNGCSGAPSSIKVKVNPLPKPNLVDGTICKDASGNTIRNFILDTGLSNINHSFNWNFNGTPIPNYFQNPYLATQIGVYSVFATNTSTGCRSNPAASASITIVNPAIKLFAYVSNNLSGNSDITVNVQSGTGPFQYQLDNGAFQNSNVFTSVSPGQHNITVIDAFNCTNLKTKAMVLDYPNYFTPNGDNYNDNWNIYGIQDQPFAKIYIYDRYGKLIAQVNPLSLGWDGNYNGSPLIATDYWFVVEYLEKDSNGIDVWKTFKSHFSLIR
jgi:gliding motility-associated-like protein